ncbi:Protein phosphatase CheZ [Vibrio chagasii]|nr:Protein phosphatase CheZ [Vibrio chagasii]
MNKQLIDLEDAKALVSALESGDITAANIIIESSYREADTELFKGVGKLTRKVYDVAQDLLLDEKLANNASEIPDARGGLDYILSKTEESANITIDFVDSTLSTLEGKDAQSEQVLQGIDDFMGKKLSPQEFIILLNDIKKHIISVDSSHRLMKSQLNDVLLAQGYQDLTGQVVKKISTCLHDIEENLVTLLTMSGNTTNCTTKVEEKAPALTGPTIVQSQETVENQDDVDDLLSSLGF